MITEAMLAQLVKQAEDELQQYLQQANLQAAQLRGRLETLRQLLASAHQAQPKEEAT